MAWNEPGNNGNKRRDPWGSGNDPERENGDQGKENDHKDDDRVRDTSTRKPSDPWGKERKSNGNPSNGNADFDETIRKLKKAGNQLLDNIKGKPTSPSSPPPRNSLWIPAGVVVAAVVVWAGSGFYSVGQSQEAVVQRLGQYLKTNASGLHWSPTLIDRVNLVNVASIRSYADNTRLLTADNNLLDVRIAVQYQIGNARHYVFNVHDPEQTLRDSLNAALNHAIGDSGLVNALSPALEVSRFQQAATANNSVRHSASDANNLPLISATPLVANSLLNGREELAPLVQKELQASLDRYQTGLSIQSVNIERISIPSEVQDSADDVAEARQERQQAIENARAYGNALQPLANGQAQQIINMAKVYQNTIVAHARGETAQFLAQLQAYKVAPEVTRERLYLDTMSEIYHDHPKAFVSLDPSTHSVVNLPLNQLIGQYTNQSTNEASPSDGSAGNGGSQDSSSSSDNSSLSRTGSNSDTTTVSGSAVNSAGSDSGTTASDEGTAIGADTASGSTSSAGNSTNSDADDQNTDSSGYVNVGSNSDSGQVGNGGQTGNSGQANDGSDDGSASQASDSASGNDADTSSTSQGSSAGSDDSAQGGHS